MARKSRGGTRTAPKTSKAPTQQKRQASTLPARPVQPASNVPANVQKPPQTLPNQKQPGLFGQMASTAAGVAVGHSIGHGITSLFTGGGSSEIPAPQESNQQSIPEQTQYQTYSTETTSRNPGVVTCENDAKAFTKCLEQNNHDTSLCQWYLENLINCQQMASKY
nr:3368_t:CDS:2 [Entrophospora candida]